MASERVIVVEDEDGGFFIAELKFIDQIGTQPPVAVYKQGAYYHEQESALRAAAKQLQGSAPNGE